MLFQLCLMSGEIIQMSNKMNLIFEPADLEQASPATVSRCGMIYLEPHQLGWEPFKDSYMQHVLPDKLTKENRDLVNDLFDWLIDPCLYFINKKCKLFLVTSDMHLVQSLMRLYTCLMDEIMDSVNNPRIEGEEVTRDILSNQQVCPPRSLVFKLRFHTNIHTIHQYMSSDSFLKVWYHA